MNTLASGSLPMDEEKPEEKRSPRTETATPGGKKEIRWEVVTKTPGIAPARLIAGRLKAEGIPARAWQEGAGQAIGLTVGLLGNGYVEVPEAYAGQAREILAEDYEIEDSEGEPFEDDA